MTRRNPAGARWWQAVLGIAVSVAMVWYAFRTTPFADVWSRITAMRVVPMLVGVVLATLSFPIRVPRWSILLRREDGSAIPWQPLWHAIAMGFAANNILPLRLGEVLRIGAVSRLAPVPFPSALASVAVERVLDALTAVALLAVALMVVDLPTATGLGRQAGTAGILGLVALVGAIAVARWPRLATGPVRAVLPDTRLRSVLLGIIERLVSGLGALGDPRRAIPVVGWSIALWLVNAAAFWAAFGAFGIDVSFAGAVIVQGALLFGIALPSSPGYAGVFETVIMLTLQEFFGVPADIGLAYAITFHVCSFVPITLLGVWSLLTSGLSVRSLREAAT
ncbi:MAG: flippase-like domain-containing protein [Gemmatimonadetes bacterium]|nr:flippase-like domain-containing protein [Gemmatimonadota bacterium]MCA9762978.1 flippase-like domain-containing protein [Gemmatimonadota bacterium]MCB9505463.1 flippase-like domain-containing protein [Gemmatimonadales bacterium]